MAMSPEAAKAVEDIWKVVNGFREVLSEIKSGNSAIATELSGLSKLLKARNEQIDERCAGRREDIDDVADDVKRVAHRVAELEKKERYATGMAAAVATVVSAVVGLATVVLGKVWK